MQGRRLPGGPRPIEQIVAFIILLILTMAAATVLPYPTPAVFGVGVLAAVGVTALMGVIKYDGIPVTTKSARVIALLIDRKPTVVAAEEVARQVSANPAAFIVAEDPVVLEPGRVRELT
ncbi:MAG: hypothetical protein QG597_5257 [Actinomycetota bacterium]|nr:hypothetical protein [Actinomycetota bacterium]